MFNEDFPYVRQLDSVDCGPACLKMISNYYGVDYSISYIRGLCGTTQNGVSMLGIRNAAEYLGFHALGARVSISQLATNQILPCILHWEQRHFVVCYKIKRKRNGELIFYVADPANGRMHYTEKEIEDFWAEGDDGETKTGFVLILSLEQEQPNRHEVKSRIRDYASLFFGYMVPFRNKMSKLFLCVLFGNALLFVSPFLSQNLIDKGINGRNLKIITLIILAQFFVFITQLCTNYIRNKIMLYVNSRVDISILTHFIDRFVLMPLSFFDTRKTGDLIQRINDHERIKDFMMRHSVNTIVSFVSLIVFSAVLISYDNMLFGIFVVGNAMYVVWTMIMAKHRKELEVKRFHIKVAEQNGILQLINGIQDIKLNNVEMSKKMEWKSMQMKLFRIEMTDVFYGQIQQLGSSLFFYITKPHLSTSRKFVLHSQELSLHSFNALAELLLAMLRMY